MKLLDQLKELSNQLLLLIINIIISTDQKDGQCPVINDDNLCSKNCSNDCDCEGESKCCRTLCGGYVCSVTGNVSIAIVV